MMELGGLVDIPEKAVKLFEEYHPDCSVASWALRFAASPDNVMMVLSGMGTAAQMADNISSMKDFQPLDDGEREVIEIANQIIKEAITVPCTACRYCVDNCPKNIAIPEYFAIYNNVQQFGAMRAMLAGTY